MFRNEADAISIQKIYKMIEDDRPFDPATLQTVFFPTNNMKSRNENWTTNHACWISEWFTEFLMPTFFQRVAQLVPTDEKMRSFHLSKLRLPKEPSFKLQSYEEHKAAQALHGFEHHSIHWFIVCRGPRRVKKVHILLLTRNTRAPGFLRMFESGMGFS